MRYLFLSRIRQRNCIEISVCLFSSLQKAFLGKSKTGNYPTKLFCCFVECKPDNALYCFRFIFYRRFFCCSKSTRDVIRQAIRLLRTIGSIACTQSLWCKRRGNSVWHILSTKKQIARNIKRRKDAQSFKPKFSYQFHS
jgi:hypothetical protein